MIRRAVFFINSLRLGGAERVCVTLANQFASDRWAVELLVLNLHNATLQSDLVPGIKITDLGVRHARYSFFAIRRYISAHKPGLFLVFNHQLAVLLLANRLVSPADFRVVARSVSTLSRKTAHEPSFWHRYIVDGVVRMLYRKADKFIAQSEGMRLDLIQRYGIAPGKVVVIPNPLPGRFLRCESEISAWSDRDEELLYVGRLHPSKGLDLLLRAFALCLEKHVFLKLRLVGEGDQKPALQALAADLGISERVIFEGHARDTLPFYGRARLTLLTSHYEGFPNVLIESLSQGTPVICVDCASGPSEIVIEGINGYLVAERDPHALARAVSLALSRAWDVKRVRRKAFAHNGGSVAKIYQSLLENVTGRGAAA